MRLYREPLLFPARRLALRIHKNYRITNRPRLFPTVGPKGSGQTSLVRLERIRLLPCPLQ